MAGLIIREFKEFREFKELKENSQIPQIALNHPFKKSSVSPSNPTNNLPNHQLSGFSRKTA
jgi:hypothetical protein